jgi:2-oxoglutarate ferredoxin oxidoreductase subunit delta
VPKKRARAIEVNETWCKQCGICIAFCQPAVLKADRSGVPRVVNLDACTLCMLCELRCPDFAIVVFEDREVAASHVPAAAHAG